MLFNLQLLQFIFFWFLLSLQVLLIATTNLILRIIQILEVKVCLSQKRSSSSSYFLFFSDQFQIDRSSLDVKSTHNLIDSASCKLYNTNVPAMGKLYWFDLTDYNARWKLTMKIPLNGKTWKKRLKKIKLFINLWYRKFGGIFQNIRKISRIYTRETKKNPDLH
jgi:hypothetical protein